MIVTGGHEEAVHVFGELQHLNAADGYLRRAAQHVEEADAEQARETFVDHLERRHAPARDAGVGRLIVGVDVAGVDAVQQGVDFVLCEDVVDGHGYCITKLVKYTSSTPGLPVRSLRIFWISARVSVRTLSLPSAVAS